MRVVHFLREADGSPTEDAERLLREPEVAFGENVRRMRLAYGRTQRQLAEELLVETGVKLDASAITRIEQGRTVSLRQALALSFTLNAMGVDIMLMEPDDRDLPSLLEGLRRDVAQMEQDVAAWQQKASTGSAVLETQRRLIAELEAQIDAVEGT